MADGRSDKEIAARLDVSLATVRSHLQRLYREHGFRNRADAAAGWVRYRRATAVTTVAESLPKSSASSPPSVRGRTLPEHRHSWLPGSAVVAAILVILVLLIVMTRPAILQAMGWREAAGVQSGGVTAMANVSVTAWPTTSTVLSRVAASRPSSEPRVAPAAAAIRPAASLSSRASDGHLALPPPAPVIQTELATGQLALINQDRASASTPLLQLPPVHWNGCLASAATQVAQGLAARGYLGATRGVALDLGCGLGAAPAETAAYWATISDAQLNAIFMSDPAERARILGPYHYIGAAWARSPSGVAFLVIEFA